MALQLSDRMEEFAHAKCCTPDIELLSAAER